MLSDRLRALKILSPHSPFLDLKISPSSLIFPPAARLAIFKQQQLAAAQKVGEHLRGDWTARLRQIVLENIAQVGKGWFAAGSDANRAGASSVAADAYRFSKLRKMLIALRVRMQSTVRTLAVRSVWDYVEHMLCALETAESRFVLGGGEEFTPLNTYFAPPVTERESSENATPGVGSVFHHLCSLRAPVGGAVQCPDHSARMLRILAPRGLFLLELRVGSPKASTENAAGDSHLDFSPSLSDFLDAVCGGIIESGFQEAFSEIPLLEQSVVPHVFSAGAAAGIGGKDEEDIDLPTLLRDLELDGPGVSASIRSPAAAEDGTHRGDQTQMDAADNVTAGPEAGADADGSEDGPSAIDANASHKVIWSRNARLAKSKGSPTSETGRQQLYLPAPSSAESWTRSARRFLRIVLQKSLGEPMAEFLRNLDLYLRREISERCLDIAAGGTEDQQQLAGLEADPADVQRALQEGVDEEELLRISDRLSALVVSLERQLHAALSLTQHPLNLVGIFDVSIKSLRHALVTHLTGLHRRAQEALAGFLDNLVTKHLRTYAAYMDRMRTNPKSIEELVRLRYWAVYGRVVPTVAVIKEVWRRTEELKVGFNTGAGRLSLLELGSLLLPLQRAYPRFLKRVPCVHLEGYHTTPSFGLHR